MQVSRSRVIKRDIEPYHSATDRCGACFVYWSFGSCSSNSVSYRLWLWLLKVNVQIE